LRVMDTAILYPHALGTPLAPRKNSLKYLTKKYLQREIQKEGGTVVGHNPVEDAQAALDLVKLKMEKGPAFGVHVISMGVRRRNLLTVLGQKTKRSVGRPHVLGPASFTKSFKNMAGCLAEELTDPADKAALKAQCTLAIANSEKAQSGKFVWITLPSAEGLDEFLTSFYAAAPGNCLFMVCTGNRSMKKLESLQKRSVQARISRGDPLSNAEKQELRDQKRFLQNHHFWLAAKRNA